MKKKKKLFTIESKRFDHVVIVPVNSVTDVIKVPGHGEQSTEFLSSNGGHFSFPVPFPRMDNGIGADLQQGAELDKFMCYISSKSPIP